MGFSEAMIHAAELRINARAKQAQKEANVLRKVTSIAGDSTREPAQTKIVTSPPVSSPPPKPEPDFTKVFPPSSLSTKRNPLAEAGINPIAVEQPYCNIWVITAMRHIDFLIGDNRKSKQIDMAFTLATAKERLLTVAELWDGIIDYYDLRNPTMPLSEFLELVELQTEVHYDIEPYETVIARENLCFLP